MAIVYQGDAGLNAGISQAGGALAQALGQVLQQRKMQSQFKSINEKIKDKPLSTTLLQEILAEPGGAQYLQQFGPVIAPVLKEQARAQGAQQWLQNTFPGIVPSPLATGGATLAIPQTPALTPIQEANAIQQPQDSATPTITPTQEAQSVQATVPDISGVPATPPIADSNRRSPAEQTIYQQGGQAGMGINPPQEGGGVLQAQMAAASQAQPNATPANAQPPPAQPAQGGFDITKLSDIDITKLAGSPYKEHQQMAQVEIQRRAAQNKQRSGKEMALLKLNEPKLAEVNEKLENFSQSGLGFDRMKQILEKEGSKFPSSFTAALFDLEGENGLSKLGRSKLDPAVQEFSKLVVNQLKDAKGTFGARLTNLDVNTYLRGLPSLLNSPEGRLRILNQLQTLNKINQVHNEGILTEFEKAGGSDQISYSDAVARAKKATAREVNQLKEQFVNPNKNKFQTMPDPSLFKGKRLQDETTGEIFISDGITWQKGA